MKILGMGVPELLIILAVILLIFGPKNLPKLGASVGKTVKSLREGLGGGEKLVEADDEEEAVEEIVEEAAPAAAPKKTVKVAKKADKVDKVAKTNLSFPYRGANPPSLAPSNRPRHPCRGRLRILRRAGGRREATRHLRYDGAVRPDGERGARASRLARR